MANCTMCNAPATGAICFGDYFKSSFEYRCDKHRLMGREGDTPHHFHRWEPKPSVEFPCGCFEAEWDGDDSVFVTCKPAHARDRSSTSIFPNCRM